LAGGVCADGADLVGAVAVKVAWKSSRGSRDIEHLGSAHTDAEVELMKAVAAQRIAGPVVRREFTNNAAALCGKVDAFQAQLGVTPVACLLSFEDFRR
jgi:hypothetical protein